MRALKWMGENPVETGLCFALAVVAGLTTMVAVTSPDKPKALAVGYSGLADWGGEGVLLAAPKGGPDRRATWGAFPDTLSVVFSDERVAREFYDEAVSNGERVCLSDLGPQRAEHHGQRWWLFTC